MFYFNTEFMDPRTKVHINSIQAKDTVSRLHSLAPRKPNFSRYALWSMYRRI